MRNLQHEDTGAYWCAVEIGGIFVKDAIEQLHLTVQSGKMSFTFKSKHFFFVIPDNHILK